MTKLAKDHGRIAKPILIKRFARAELEGKTRRIATSLSLRRLQKIVPDDWKAPDSDLATRALKVAETICPDIIFGHAHRTYCFGALLAARNNLKLDREAFFIAAILYIPNFTRLIRPSTRYNRSSICSDVKGIDGIMGIFFRFK